MARASWCFYHPVREFLLWGNGHGDDDENAGREADGGRAATVPGVVSPAVVRTARGAERTQCGRAPAGRMGDKADAIEIVLDQAWSTLSNDAPQFLPPEFAESAV